MIRISAILFVGLVLAAPLRAQIILPAQNETLPTFEVATVKPSSRDLGRSFHTHIWWSDNSYRTENTTLRDLIRNAYNLSAAQLTGGPDALLDARWDINAKIADDEFARIEKLSSDDRNHAFHLMQQAVLADRFGLKVHTETRELAVFDLVVDKAGSKLQPVATGSAADKAGSDSVSTNIHRTSATMHATDAAIGALTEMLSRQPELDGRLVIDKTGLTGKYDWSLEWQPQRLSPVASLEDNGPSFLDRLEARLEVRP